MALADLQHLRNPDGGWPYYYRKQSRLQPTAWATLACAASGESTHNSEQFFVTRLRTDGLFTDVPGVNYSANALALLAAAVRRPKDKFDTRTLEAVLNAKGVKLAPATEYCQNNQLQAWPWVDGAFSSVEPTAWTLLALKKRAPVQGPLADAYRRWIREAERLLMDRACASGDWNYGNANMYGRELHAHAPTTAVALLALQVQKNEPAVRRGMAFPWSRRLSEGTRMALALATIVFRVFDTPSEDVEAALGAALDRFTPVDSILGGAMALYALTQLNIAAPPFVFNHPWRERLESRLAPLLRAPVSSPPYWRDDFRVPPSSAVCLYPAADYRADFTQIIGEGLADLGVDVRGRAVLLKPNIDEYEAGTVINTNPLVVAGAAEACLRAGASQAIVGEGPGHRRDIEYLLAVAGIDVYLRHLRVRFVDLNHDDVERVSLRSRFTRWSEVWLLVELLRADVIVSMPKLKTHHWAA